MSTSANPRANQTHPSDAPREATGAVAADSLAAESIKDSGGFAENENAHTLSVKGHQSTLNTTDSSSATALHPAESGAAREKQDALGAGADERGTTGLKLDALGQAEFTGKHSQQGYAGGPSDGAGTETGAGAGVPVSGGNVKAGDSDFGLSGVSSGSAGGADSNVRSTGDGFSGNPTSTSTTTTTSASSGGSGGASGDTSGNSGGDGGSGPAPGTGIRPHVDAAPNYAQTVQGSNQSSGTFKPKGANLEDADVTGSIPQTKTFTGDVGGVHDPGRLAERNFEGANTDPNAALGQAGEEGGGKGNTGGEGRGGQYDVLESERA